MKRGRSYRKRPEHDPQKTALEDAAMRAKDGENLPVFLLQRKE